MPPITKDDYDKIIAERPRKFTPEQVGYRKAPRGSEQRCQNCAHFFERVVDGLTTCEIMRSAETDDKGVDPKYLCDWWTRDGEDHPLAGKENDDDK